MEGVGFVTEAPLGKSTTQNSYNFSVYLGRHPDELYYVDSYFDAVYETSWLSSELVKEMLHDLVGCSKIEGDTLTIRDIFTGVPLVFHRPS